MQKCRFLQCKNKEIAFFVLIAIKNRKHWISVLTLKVSAKVSVSKLQSSKLATNLDSNLQLPWCKILSNDYSVKPIQTSMVDTFYCLIIVWKSFKIVKNWFKTLTQNQLTGKLKSTISKTKVFGQIGYFVQKSKDFWTNIFYRNYF